MKNRSNTNDLNREIFQKVNHMDSAFQLEKSPRILTVRRNKLHDYALRYSERRRSATIEFLYR